MGAPQWVQRACGEGLGGGVWADPRMRLDRGWPGVVVAQPLAGRCRLLGVAGGGHVAARCARVERLVGALAPRAWSGVDRLRLAGPGAGPYAGTGFPAVGADAGLDCRHLGLFWWQDLWPSQAGTHREPWQKLGR